MLTSLAGMLLLTSLAGAAIPLGALLARLEHLRSDWLEAELRHFVIAFGGGILLGAVARVLVPEGIAHLGSPALAVGILVAGGVAFMALERRRARRGRSAPQLTAMLSDYLPECLALGGMFAAGAADAPLLALLIAAQNLPEGFNAFREMVAGRPGSEGGVLLRMVALVPLGPLCGLVGWYVLAGTPMVLGGIMLFSAGGILYLTFQDIAPEARLEKHWAPPLGAVLGFAFALGGDLLLGA